ncbi:unnamed protein product [Cutaneotrichosporon oleaginosum]
MVTAAGLLQHLTEDLAFTPQNEPTPPPAPTFSPTTMPVPAPAAPAGAPAPAPAPCTPQKQKGRSLTPRPLPSPTATAGPKVRVHSAELAPAVLVHPATPSPCPPMPGPRPATPSPPSTPPAQITSDWTTVVKRRSARNLRKVSPSPPPVPKAPSRCRGGLGGYIGVWGWGFFSRPIPLRSPCRDDCNGTHHSGSNSISVALFALSVWPNHAKVPKCDRN